MQVTRCLISRTLRHGKQLSGAVLPRFGPFLIPASRQLASSTVNRQLHVSFTRHGFHWTTTRKSAHCADKQTHIVSRTRAKVDRVLDWTQVVLHDGIERGRGRLSPALLNDIKFEESGAWVPLSQLALTTAAPSGLRIQVPSESLCNATGAAIARAHLPGVTVERDADDSNALHLTIAQPTSEMRMGIIANLHEAVEEAKGQIAAIGEDAINSLGGGDTFGAGQVREMAEMARGLIEGMYVAAKSTIEK